MDNQFNTLVSSYRDNYIEYKLSGKDSNKKAYTSAKEGIDNIIANLQAAVNNNQSQISGYYNEDTKKRLNQLHEESKNSKLQLTSTKDGLETAKMRYDTTPTDLITVDMTKYYIAVGVLTVVAVGLSLF